VTDRDVSCLDSESKSERRLENEEPREKEATFYDGVGEARRPKYAPSLLSLNPSVESSKSGPGRECQQKPFGAVRHRRDPVVRKQHGHTALALAPKT
jgi:hypothetical protein